MSRHWAWSLPKFTPTRAAFARPGPALPRSPTSSLLCSPPTPCPFGHRSGSPCRGLPRCGRLFCASGADDTCARHVSCVGDGSPALRHTGMCRGEAGPPRLRGRPLRACHGPTPRRIGPLLAHRTERPLLPSDKCRTLGIREAARFRGRSPMAHTFACLRIAEAISGTGARLATGSGGLTLGRAGFAPAGRQTKFHEGIAPPSPLTRRAWSH